MRAGDALAAAEAANVTLNTENAQLRQALRVIRKGLSEEADGTFWPARRWLDTRDIFHGDLSGYRVLELVAKHALHGKVGSLPVAAPMKEDHGAGLAAGENNTGLSTTEAATESAESLF